MKARRNPELVRSLTISNTGEVSILWKDGQASKIGFLDKKYWMNFGRMFVRSFSITGGALMQEFARQQGNGTITPMQYLGCNLKIGLR